MDGGTVIQGELKRWGYFCPERCRLREAYDREKREFWLFHKSLVCLNVARGVEGKAGKSRTRKGSTSVLVYLGFTITKIL